MLTIRLVELGGGSDVAGETGRRDPPAADALIALFGVGRDLYATQSGGEALEARVRDGWPGASSSSTPTSSSKLSRPTRNSARVLP